MTLKVNGVRNGDSKASLLTQVMSLDLSKLENVRDKGNKKTAQCPACAAEGHDSKGEHLSIEADGKFGCVVHPGEGAEAKAHRKEIHRLVGAPGSGEQKCGPIPVRI